MAKNPYYVYDLPYQPRKELCRILDADRRWEELGGIHMHIDVTTLTLIGQAVMRDKSPTWELLDKWSERNSTIKQLFAFLAKMDHQRAMSVLLPYVDKKYHKLVRSDDDPNGFTDSPETVFHRRSIPSSFASGIPTESTCTVGGQSRLLPPEYQFDTVLATRRQGPLNINESKNAVAMESKLNSLNQHHQSRSLHSLRLPSGMRNVRADAANCDESNTDNCASEKMRNLTKPSRVSPIAVGEKEKNTMAAAAKVDEKFYEGLKSLEKSLFDVMKISYKDILKATDDFADTRTLGRGGFGAVYKGEWKGTSVAIKRLMPREGGDSISRHLVSLKQSANELAILKCCRFDHILPLYGVSLDGPEPCLVYQLMVNGSLEDRLLCRNGTTPLTWSQRSSIAECTAKGLNYLHTTPGRPLVHGDIKSANILLDANMEAKIGDFGLTREGPDSDNTHVKVSKLHGTECYLPPEYLRHRQLSPQVDVYSYGIVLMEMATGLRPYDSHREEKLLVYFVSDCQSSGRLDSIRDTKAGEENMMWFGELLRIGQECSSKDKNKRPTMQRVLECFKQIKDELSMVDKIRRLSNDRGSLDDTSKLKQMTPMELQVFYDIRKEKCGTAATANAGTARSCVPSSLPNEISLPVPVSILQLENDQSSEARPSTSAVAPDPKSHAAEPSTSTHQNHPAPTTRGQSTVTHYDNDTPTNSSDEPSTEKTPPVPIFTVLQLQVSEVSESSCSSESARTEPSSSDISRDFSNTEYSVDSAMS